MLLTVILMVYDGIENPAFTYSTGAPAGSSGYAGSPADGGKTCAVSGCHFDAQVVDVQDWIITDVGTKGYLPDSIYTITVNATDSSSERFGFTASVQNLSGKYLGNIFSFGNNEIQINGNNNYATHTINGITGSATKSWSFNWIAPPKGSGTAIVFAAINAANSNGNPSGDFIYTSKLEIQEAEVLDEFQLYPNPATDIVNFRSHIETAKPIVINIYNNTGQLVWQESERLEINEEYNIELSGHAAGIYHLEIPTESETILKKFVKLD